MQLCFTPKQFLKRYKKNIKIDIKETSFKQGRKVPPDSSTNQPNQANKTNQTKFQHQCQGRLKLFLVFCYFQQNLVLPSRSSLLLQHLLGRCERTITMCAVQASKKKTRPIRSFKIDIKESSFMQGHKMPPDSAT